MNRLQGLTTRLRTGFLFGLIALSLTACGGGAKTEANPDLNRGPTSTYTGPAPATADIQAFRVNLWDPLRGNNRCGSCHGVGGQSPQFARSDDVNQAYAAVQAEVDLSQPAESRLVRKVASGHHCWLDSSAACADSITAYITAWAGGSEGGGATDVQLTPPISRDAGASKSLPPESDLFATHVHPLLKEHCRECHSSSERTAQSPFFASPGLAEAYDGVRGKIDLNEPGNSRLVVRLRDESHNCWSDCERDAETLRQAIQSVADSVLPTPVDERLVLSKALKLDDGIVASSGGRYEANMIAKYEFKTGGGTTAYDTSGVEPALNLTLSGNYDWVGGWGIEFDGGKAQGSTSASSKLAKLIRATGEYSVEAWVVPANTTQEGPARIISYSGGSSARNFTLGQTLQSYDFLNRSSVSDGNGGPALSTPDADNILQATQQHVVITYDPSNGRRIYVNGLLVDVADPLTGGSLGSWDDTYALVLGNEVSREYPWRGRLRMVTIYNRALNQGQIAQNFGVGVGEKYYLLFHIGHLIDVPDTYVMLETSQFDSHSYLFQQPTVINLRDDASFDNIPLQGLKIGINGREALVGQAFSTLDTRLDDSSHAAGGQVLSMQGAVIGSESGPETDEFFLSFKQLGSHQNIIVEASTTTPPTTSPAIQADIGVRTFDEINATMASLTGVSPTRPEVQNTFNNIRQQLPAIPNIEAFLTSHQIAITQLAIEYCSALVSDATLRTSYFPRFSFSGSGFDGTQRNALIAPLLTRIIGTDLNSQPEIRDELEGLIDTLAGSCSGSCSGPQTEVIAKASCAATLGSAAVLLK